MQTLEFDAGVTVSAYSDRNLAIWDKNPTLPVPMTDYIYLFVGPPPLVLRTAVPTAVDWLLCISAGCRH